MGYQAQNETYSSVYRFEITGGFNVHFDANNGTGDVQNIGMTAPGAAGSVLDSAKVPVNGTRSFLGWATRADAAEPDATADTMVNGETTFYAVYGPEPIAIGENGNWFINGVDSGIPAK